MCMTEAMIGPNSQDPSSQHQVFTLGAKKNSWRMMECSIPHRPCSNSVCIDGVIYYAAKTGTERSLMRFDVRSEKFHLITGVPAEIALSEGADFLSGYSFSLHEGVSTAVSHGIWLNIPDYDAPTQLVMPKERNTR
uniref:F-box associated beta-propeller type 3 domain-containing protein n=1 Tax=Brassica oleracea TaxID=3712 RepID=A0A3P6EBA4_BRAOL|nr:unnamed protein product [Brassica oleracea]